MSESPSKTEDIKAKPEPGTADAANADPATQQINIRVQNQQGQEVFFKIKKNTKMSKLIEAYCQRSGLSAQSVRFAYDGKRIGPSATPLDFDMEDNDVIDCILEQTGGSN